MFPLVCTCLSCVTYVVVEEIHDKGGHATIDADEEVDAGQHHIGCAGHAKNEGGRVHQGGDGPPAGYKETPLHWDVKRDLKNLWASTTGFRLFSVKTLYLKNLKLTVTEQLVKPPSWHSAKIKGEW